MKRMVIYSILFALFVVLVSNAQDVIEEPVSDYLNFLTAPDGSDLLRLDADIDSDGRKEVFLSRTEYRNAKAGFIWTVYLPVEGGYKRWRKPICFRTDALFIGECEQFDGPALVTYWPGGGGTGALIAFQIRDNKIEETVLHIDPGRSEEGRKIYDGIFEENEPPKIEKWPVSEFADLIDALPADDTRPAKVETTVDEEIAASVSKVWLTIIIAAVVLCAIAFSYAWMKRRKQQ